MCTTVDGRFELCHGVWLVSGFPRESALETSPKRFVRRAGKTFVPDDFSDELCVVLQVEQGLVVLVGCSHPGILNMVSHVHGIFDQPVLAVYGGTHLVEADESRICATIEALHQMGVGMIGLSHCSGQLAEGILREKGQVMGCHLRVGDTIFYN